MSLILSFLLNQWRIILLAVIVGGGYWYVHALRADNASLRAEKSASELLVKQINAQNVEKYKIYLGQISNLESENKDLKAKNNIDVIKLKESLNAQVNKSDSLLNAVRVWQDRANNSGLPKDDKNTSLSTQAERDCYSTIADLTNAGKSCAIDYKSLYDTWDKYCNVYGCQ